jgi:hypothetical protein
VRRSSTRSHRRSRKKVALTLLQEELLNCLFLWRLACCCGSVHPRALMHACRSAGDASIIRLHQSPLHSPSLYLPHSLLLIPSHKSHQPPFHGLLVSAGPPTAPAANLNPRQVSGRMRIISEYVASNPRDAAAPIDQVVMLVLNRPSPISARLRLHLQRGHFPSF